MGASETGEGGAWAEGRVKQLTGGDWVAARSMRRDFFGFTPQFKLSITGNNKPVLRIVDDAARRRLNTLPFVHKPSEPDRELETNLREEWPGILRWLIDRCLDWLANGLARPESVRGATEAHFSAGRRSGGSAGPTVSRGSEPDPAQPRLLSSR